MDADWTDRAIGLCREAQGEGVPAFVIHTLENGNIRLIGVELPPDLVAQMLRSAAEALLAQTEPATLN